MIINNKKVQGLYIYNTDSEGIEFTKDDLVVSGNNIYVCDAESVSGIDPALDTSYEYYHPYPGSKIISASEYFQYIKEGGSDKYISSQALSGILQGYQFGLGMEGVIEDWIDKNGDTTLNIDHITDRPLDNLMLTETLNRGMVKIDRRLEQIVGGEISGTSFSTMFGFLDKTDEETDSQVDYQLILSQYTYKQTDTSWIRIQEMMSPLSGVSVYRYMSWDDGEFPSSGNIISSWRNVFSYSKAIQSKLDALQEYYNSLADQIRTQISSVIGCFRFKEVYNGSSYENTTKIEELPEGVYTVCLEGDVGGRVYTDSVTIRLKNRMPIYPVFFNKLSGYIRLSFDTSVNNGGSIELICTENETRFLSIYSREEKER